MDSKMLFITGRGRSGSWLLRSILDTHDEICVAPEAMFIVHLKKKYGMVSKWSPSIINEFCNDLFEEKKIQFWWDLKKVEVKKYLLAQNPNMNFSELCKLLFKQYAAGKDKKDANILADKNPENTLFLNELLDLFPKAKAIFMIRDPRDNVNSFQNVDFDLDNSFALAYRWRFYNKYYLKYSSNFQERIFLLKFEDLVMHPRREVKKICEFLKIEYSDSLLQFFEKETTTYSFNRRINKPISPNAAFRWKKEKYKHSNLGVEKICIDLIKYFDYEITDFKNPQINYLKFYVGLFKGFTSSMLELIFYGIPFKIRMRILNSYRNRTYNLVSSRLEK